MGIWRPIAKLEVKFETWGARCRNFFERMQAGPDVDIETWREEKEEAKVRKAAYKQRRREQRRQRTWKDYIPYFPDPIGYTPLHRLDEMMASGDWMGQEYRR